MESLLPQNTKPMSLSDVMQLNSLVLAFVGDSVQQLYVRTKLANMTTAKAGQLHILASKEIKASAQAECIDKILPNLSQDELGVYKRARNSKMNTIAKNATYADYKKASGYEAVLGYLYLLGKNERLAELIEMSENIEEIIDAKS